MAQAHQNPIHNPKEANNLTPDEILQKCKEYIINQLNSDFNLTLSNNTKFSDIRDKFYIVEGYIEIASNYIEIFGYHREAEKKYISRVHDVSHIIYGAYCDIFVSADKNSYLKQKRFIAH